VQANQQVTAYLSPSAFIPAGATAALSRVIDDGMTFCQQTVTASHRVPAMITLPLHHGWFHPMQRDALLSAIGRVPHPLAILPGGSGDPMDSASSVRGLAEVLNEASQPVALLRTDLAGLGAVARACPRGPWAA
jgi:hypothetical protein